MTAVKEVGKRLRTEHLEVWSAVSLLSHCRVAIIVAKYGHTIVQRNRLRRRLRELARTRLIPFCLGRDLIIWALPSAYSVEFAHLSDQINAVKIWLIAETPEM